MRSVALVVVLAACGGSSKPLAPAAPVATAPAPEPAATEPTTATTPTATAPVTTADPVTATTPVASTDPVTATAPIASTEPTVPAGGCAGGYSTIGIGAVGTIGHGSGTGSSGGCAGGMRGRKSNLPEIRIGTPTLDEGLDQAIVRRFIKRNIPRFLYCYEKQLTAHPEIAGSIRVTFTIGADGKVADATATGFNSDVAECIAKATNLIEFPRPHKAPMKVSYPFTFKQPHFSR